MTKRASDGAAESNRLHRELATAVVSFHEAVARAVGMTAAERKCAGLLAERGRMTPGELVHETGLTSGAITGIVDRLTKAGFAERVAHPTDRRSVIVEARRSDELFAMFGPVFATLSAAMDKLDARYSDAERALILRHLADTIAILRAETGKLLAAPAIGKRPA
ncbi:MAG TPA: MarR family transcriptional regulator [Sphingomonas sp.]|uniref:MarR family winged helix-turn-helix transcriptional regulator n=1 Tax=Sphingomonas sp. TaxID=28214 RepID=UPI002C6C6051|nr:MarR family transcriptional regulator [Sphingomonas sp.]HMI19646.1 MarR family transcriptional regulator [Sphingomonas sp.]